eukprot:2933638-Amphidinium_carterae.2
MEQEMEMYRDVGHSAVLSIAFDKVKADREMMLAVVERDGCLLRYAAKNLTQDRKLVLRACTQHFQAIMYASYKLLLDHIRARCKVARLHLENLSAFRPIHVRLYSTGGAFGY